MNNLGKEWDNLSIRIRKQHPLCLDPLHLHKDRLKESKEVHHNIPRRLATHLTLEQANLIPVCRECHEALEKLVYLNLILAPQYIQKLKTEFESIKRSTQIDTGIDSGEQTGHNTPPPSPDLISVAKGGYPQSLGKISEGERTAPFSACIFQFTPRGACDKAAKSLGMDTISAPGCCQLGSGKIYCAKMNRRKDNFCPRCLM